MSASYVKNAADETQVREADGKVKRGRERELNDICALLSTREGRRFIWRYLGKCGVFTTSFHNSGSVTAYNEGGRNIGLMLLADVNDASPDAYLTMMKENKGDQ